MLWTGQAGTLTYTIVGIFTAIWFLDLAWFREQFCNYLCPYARLQGALTDADTLMVQYEAGRGEPRGGADAKTAGRCIECNKCVVVCPQGIDIREGFQLECIACARCVDACDIVMGHLGHATLVSWGSLAESQGKQARRLRPRTVLYAALLTSIAVAAILFLRVRVPFDAAVQRAPGSLFIIDGDGFVRNTYLVRVTNKDASTTAIRFQVQVTGVPAEDVTVQEVWLSSTQSATVPLIIRMKASADLPRTIPIQVRVQSPTRAMTLDATFKTEGHIGTGTD